LFFALITAILKSGPCRLKQICHMTQIKLRKIYSLVNLFSVPLPPQFGAGTDKPWKVTDCHHNSHPRSQNWPRSTPQMCRRPRNKEELIPLFSFLFLFLVKHENAQWISKTNATGWFYRIPQTRQQGLKHSSAGEDKLLLKCTVPKYPTSRAKESPDRQISSVTDNNLLLWSPDLSESRQNKCIIL